MSGVDWDTVEPGDPDPTDDGDCPIESDDAPWRWYCTRDAGHDGPHVAGTGETVGAVWP